METSKKTLLLGASDNPARYSFMAINQLRRHGHQVIAIGKKKVVVADVQVLTDPILYKDIDTVTLYLSPPHQASYYDYILQLHPKRVIFNPGTENEVLEELLHKNNISYMEACTLVLLSTGQY